MSELSWQEIGQSIADNVRKIVESENRMYNLFKKANAEKRRLRKVLQTTLYKIQENTNEAEKERERIMKDRLPPFSPALDFNRISFVIENGNVKCNNKMVYPTDGSKPTCAYCGWHP